MKKALLSIFALSFHCIFAQDLTSNLKLCMPFEGNANDKSGQGNHGAVSGATLTTDRFGNASSAYQFNGTSNYISVSNFANLAPTNELTISMWAKADVTSSNCLFILNPDDQNDRCVGCAQYGNSPATMMIWDYGDIAGSGRSVKSGITIDNTNWHHYVYIISQSGNSKRMYLDGVSQYNGTYGDLCTNKNLPIYFGGGTSDGGGSIRFHGKIDDICVYNRALNANEVTALYNGTNTCFAVGIKELEEFAKGIFYPTVSANALFSYSGEMDKMQQVEIYDTTGKLIKTVTKNDISQAGNQINLQSESKGMYLVKIIREGSFYTQKIIVE